MDLILVFVLSLCWGATAARSMWTDKPWIIVSSDEIEDGETVNVSCTLPIDYRGGECRLFREESPFPFRLKTALDYVCIFHLSSKVLLGPYPVGSRVLLRCDYVLQEYYSTSSDYKGVSVWGSRPSPSLTVSRHFVSPQDSVEVTCSPPLGSASSCIFYRDDVYVAEGSCSRNLTGKELAIWEKPSLVVWVNLTCRYDPYKDQLIRSEPSNQHLLFVVDPSHVSSSVHCHIPVDAAQLETLGNQPWTFHRTDAETVTIHVTNSSLALNQTCDHTL